MAPRVKPDICGRCDSPLTDENWSPSYRRNRYLLCKPCDNTRQREYNRANPEQVWKRNKLKLYGMTYEAYHELLTKQNGVCAICGTADPGRGHQHLAVDHCHTTNIVRGLLCHSCNTGLGHFKDSISLLDKAKEYLK